MSRPYYTLCVWEPDFSAWFDAFGSYSRGEVAQEKTSYLDSGFSPRHLTIIKTDETAAAMIAARDALPAPK